MSLGCGGFAWAGFSVNHLDIAPQYAAILMGISNTLGTVPGIISPSITGYLVEDKSVESWQHVFFITAFIYAIGAIVYAIFASGDRQEWSKLDRDEELVSIPISDGHGHARARPPKIQCPLCPLPANSQRANASSARCHI